MKMNRLHNDISMTSITPDTCNTTSATNITNTHGMSTSKKIFIVTAIVMCIFTIYTSKWHVRVPLILKNLTTAVQSYTGFNMNTDKYATPQPAAAAVDKRFALALQTKMETLGVRIYGSLSCGWSERQKKELHIDANSSLFVNCDTNADACTGVQAFPTWDINGVRRPGFMKLHDAAQLVDSILQDTYLKYRKSIQTAEDKEDKTEEEEKEEQRQPPGQPKPFVDLVTTKTIDTTDAESAAAADASETASVAAIEASETASVAAAKASEAVSAAATESALASAVEKGVELHLE